MKEHKTYWALVAVLLVALISSTAACITITAPEEAAPPSTAPDVAPARPVINSFTASPGTISSGQTATLSWNVSGATTVTVEPAVGGVAPSGTTPVSPATTTTYTLAASSEGSSITSSVTVTVTSAVTPAPTGKPDLVITETWFSSKILYYKMKNQGDADAKSSQSYLYVNDVQKSSDYVGPVAAGEEVTGNFSRYVWPYDMTGLTAGGWFDVGPFNTKVCADAENAIVESDEGNNCSTKIWGPTFTYDFVEKAPLAAWKSGAGKLKWPMVAGDTKGAAFAHGAWLEDGRSHSNALSMYPQQVSHGSIQGNYGDFYTDDIWRPSVREIVIPQMAKFTAKVGFKEGATATDGVTVIFSLQDTSGALVVLKKLDVYYDGVLDVYEVDLSHMAGEEVYFILRVEAKESSEQDWLVWVDPKIVQE